MLLSIIAKQGFLSFLVVLLIFFIEDKFSIIPSISDNSENQYSTFTMGIAAIGGVFIGLYYSGLTAAAGAVYSNVPNQVRDLLVREKAGSSYIQFVAFCVAIALLFSITFLIWEKTSVLGLSLLVLMSVGVVFGFVTLGAQAFNFFNPINLSYAPFKRLNKLPKDVVEGGFFGQDPSFQNHSRKLASVEIQTLKSISKICEQSESLRGEPFRIFCVNLTRCLIGYRSLKSRIPLDSKWYTQEIKHPDWYKDYNSMLDISIQTGTRLHVTSTPETNWLEKEIWNIISSAFSSHLENQEFSRAIGLLSLIDILISNLATTHDIDLSFEWAAEIVKHISEHCNGISSSDASELEYLELISRAASLSTTIMLGFSKSVLKLSETNLQKAASDLQKMASLFDASYLPLNVYKNLNSFVEKIELEKRIEGRVVTSNWYIADRLRLELLNYLKPYLETYIDKCFGLLDILIVHAQTENKLLAESVIYSSKIELENKLIQHHIPEIEITMESLGKVKKTDFDWPKIKFDEVNASFESLSKDFHKKITDHTLALLQVTRPSDVPDFAGQFMAYTNENILCALLDGDITLAIELLSRHAICCYNKTQELFPELDNYNHPNSEAQIRSALTPILDLVEMLGLAIVIFEFRNEAENRRKIEDIWSAIVSASNNENLNQWMLGSTNLVLSSFYAEPRYEIKFLWRRRVEELLSTGSFETVERGGFGHMVNLPNHSSALINALMPTNDIGLNDVNGTTVFILECLRKSVPVEHVEEANYERRLRNQIERLQRNAT